MMRVLLFRISGVDEVCGLGKMKNDMQKPDNYIGREERGLLNKKGTPQKLLLGVSQPVLPDWSQLLISQYFTRGYLYICNRLLDKKGRLHFITILISANRFTKQITILIVDLYIRAYSRLYRKKERLKSRDF